jgi:parallel beta-helix repeat protein
MERNNLIKKGVVVAVILLFVSVSVIPSTGTIIEQSSRTLLYNGNILYVGGTGPGNYTTIQDAIDDASDGDTIYVYSGTYFEDVKINTSIVLQGEDKESTIIDAGGNLSAVIVTADNVEITGFSVKNTGPYWPNSGIALNRNEQCIVTDNIVSDCFIGIHAFITSDTTINKNTVSDSEFGIRIQATKFSTITRNTMQDNYCGMDLNAAYFNEIIENNFINNEKQVYFQIVLLNKIDNNYWERLVNIGPKPMLGILFFIIPGFIYDWNPASEPYDISLEEV